MYYLIGAGLLFIISIVIFIQARKKEKLTIQQAAEKHEKYIDELTKEKQEEYEQLIKYQVKLSQDCQVLEKQRKYEQDRAQEAHDATERVLLAEHERARAELNGIKELELEKMRNEIKEKHRALNAEYDAQELYCQKSFATTLEFYQEELAAAKSELDEFQAKRAAVNEAIRREREKEEQEDFYRISITDSDIKDIEVLRSIEPRLNNREVLSKLIYEVFIKRPLMEMEKRVLKGQKIGGIYKITYIKTGEAYIGRSVDIGNRWKEHCLSSLNIGTIAHSTFHNILAEKGLQNFTWEVLEEVDKDKQSSREKYWVDFYQTNKQYNSKAGG